MSSKLSQWTKNVVHVSCGSEYHVVGLWVDVMSRYPISVDKVNWEEGDVPKILC